MVKAIGRDTAVSRFDMDRDLVKSTMNGGVVKFHFVIDVQWKEMLIKIAKERKQTVSGFVRDIIVSTGCMIDLYHYTGDEKGRSYELCGKGEYETAGMVVSMRYKDYCRFKVIHGNNMFFSMGQLMRKVLVWFLGKWCVCGEGVFDMLKKIEKRWQKVIKYRKTWKKEHIFSTVPPEVAFRATYSTNYELLSIDLE